MRKLREEKRRGEKRREGEKRGRFRRISQQW